MSHIFITGATGVLGSSLVPLFLQRSDARLTLLIRADSQQHLERKRGALFEYWGPGPEDSRWNERIRMIAGDTGEVLLGLPPEEFELLSGEVTHIIHAAGNVKLNQPLQAARAAAVNSARNILHLAHECERRGQFVKLELVSTVGVAGKSPGMVMERPYTEPRQFRNSYETAKAEAEAVVWEHITRGLPGTIHRPSMIVGDSHTGRIKSFQVFYHVADFLAGLRTWGIVPLMPEARLDLIPVDFVANAIYHSSDSVDTKGKILHLCSGPDRAWPLRRLEEALREILGSRGRELPDLCRLRIPEVLRVYEVLGGLVPEEKAPFFRALPYLLAYLDEPQVFDNSRTESWIAGLGLRIPDIDEYLEPVLQYYWDRNAAGQEPVPADTHSKA